MKKILAMLLALMMVLSLCACGQTGTSIPAPLSTPNPATTQAASKDVATPQVTPTPVPTPEPTPVPTPAPTPEPTPEPEVTPIIEEAYTIGRALTEFTCGKAWVSFRDNNNESCYALIDENGFILYSVRENDLAFSLPVSGNVFENGTSCIFHKISNYDCAPGMIVLNSDNHVIFDGQAFGDDTSYYYLGYYDGVYFALKHIANFTTDDKYFCEIDGYGKTIQETKLEPFFVANKDAYIYDLYHYNQDISYCGDGLFQFTREGQYGDITCIYDQKTGYVGDADTHILDVISEKETLTGGGLIDTAYLHSRDFCKDDFQNVYPSVHAKYNEKIFNDPSGIYDYRGNLLAEYPEEWKIKEFSAFSNGYATVELRGVDGKTYITVVDTNATPQFDPVKADTDEAEELVEQYMSDKSNDKAGYHRAFSYDPSNDDKRNNRFDCYMDENGSVLRYIYVVSNYDELPDKYFRSRYETQSNSDEIEEAQTEKTYISPSSFSIEGKWKNIGTYTFGQVQSGAIIAFDGMTCNVCSPSDTYAFYQDGDDYRLECTTMMFSETLSFTVKIVDEDHIDIYNGSDYLEMMRVQ